MLLIVVAFSTGQAMALTIEQRLDNALGRQGSLEELKEVLTERPDLADVVVPANMNKFDQKFPIHYAIRDNPDILKYLISLGVNVNAKNANGWTALYQASAFGNQEILMTLLDAGADPNIPDNESQYPIHMAAERGKAAVVKALAEHGADVNVKDNDTTTPLIAASTNAYADVVEVLLQAGADKDAKTRGGFTALIEAERAPLPDKIYEYARIKEMLTGQAGAVTMPASKAAARPPESTPAEAGPVTEPKSGEPAPSTPAKTTLPPDKPFTFERSEISDLKIFVLSGDGNPDSAQLLMRKLFRMGYIVDRIGTAEERHNKTTVYYIPDKQAYAETLATRIGPDTVVKPVGWQTTFHIVIITGTNPTSGQ